MNLTKQVHVYSLDTSCFYNDSELLIHKKLLRLYQLRNKLKTKLHNTTNENKRCENQYRRINNLIKYFKSALQSEFQNTRLYNQKYNCIRSLRPEFLKDRNVVSVFDSFLTRTLGCEINKITKEIIIIQVYFFEVAEDLVKYGFIYNNEKYVLFSASAGQIRTKKFVMIKESSLKKHSDTLMCGLTIDRINQKGGINVNKFLAYFALANSATEEWVDFDIERSIVVEDFETLIEAEVDYIDDNDYSITRKIMKVPIPHMDGCGIMLEGITSMIRLPWVKGLMVKCNYKQFILEHSHLKNCNLGIVEDIYGKKYDILKDNIKYIFTKSQFKMWKYYNSWDEYKMYYKKFHCTAGRTNQEEEHIPDAQINYQMLQSLDMTQTEMEQLACNSIRDIKNIGSDFKTTMRLLGATKYNKNPNYMQKALMIYPELMRDSYNRQILKDVKNSLIKQAKAGKLSIQGKYTFIAPDLYAFCEWLFLGEKNPMGILKNGEVSCNLYKNNVKLDCLRSPHLYREHAVRTNIQNDETKKWFDTKCLYTSCHDLISKILQFDVDGDKSLVVNNSILCNIAERNMVDIVPLYYNMRKAQPTQLNNETLFQGLKLAYVGGNIGIYSNNISKIWNEKQITKQEINCIKLLCMENNFVIDYAKTLYKPTRPEDIDNLIKDYTNKKLPYFFKYAKDKESYQVATWKSTPVNYLSKLIPDSKLKFNNNLNKIELEVLLSDPGFKFKQEYQSIIDLYDYYNSHKKILYNHSDDKHRKGHELYVYQSIREKILELPYSKDEIVNTLVYYLYKYRKQSMKKTLWECFGKEIYDNIKHNLSAYSKVCQICGKRFVSRYYKKIYCSNKCQSQARLKKYK